MMFSIFNDVLEYDAMVICSFEDILIADLGTAAPPY